MKVRVWVGKSTIAGKGVFTAAHNALWADFGHVSLSSGASPWRT